MKAVCISCFNYYNNILKYVDDVLTEKGFDVIYITCHIFDHIKSRYTIDSKKTIQMKTKAYDKNLSIKRLYSHYNFSIKVLKKVKEIKPDLIYVMLPPNSLAKFISNYKKNNKVKLIYDIYDLWPETFPSNGVKKKLSLIFKMWGDLRK